MTKLDKKVVWKIVKSTKLLFLSKHAETECHKEELALFPDKNIQDIVNSLAKELKLKTTTEINRNISDETLQTAAEMFTYLISCLPNQKLFGFITYLFLNKTPKEIIQWAQV